MYSKTVLILLLVAFSSCQTGLIPCPTLKGDRLKRSHVRKNFRVNEKTLTASVHDEPSNSKPVRQTYTRMPEVRPALEHIDVEEWDCPKPGTKKTLPKALKENIRKNKKAYQVYYRNRADSIMSLQPAGEQPR